MLVSHNTYMPLKRDASQANKIANMCDDYCPDIFAVIFPNGFRVYI